MKIFDNIKKISKGFDLKTKEGQIEEKRISKDYTLEEVLKDVNENHNNSWYNELYMRNKDRLDDVALLYRGYEITYKEMFDNMRKYAKSMKEMGLGLDSEIPVCMLNSPELIYVVGAASLIGAKVNIFGSHYPEDYVTEIINGCNTNIIFVEDNAYQEIHNAITNSKANKIVMNSLRDSFENDIDPYEAIDRKSGLFDNKVRLFQTAYPEENIISSKEFTELGKNYKGEVDAHANLDTEFAITYTSGSTNEKRPKQIVHTNRSFVTIARFHDKELNGGFSMKNYTLYVNVPPFSNTGLVSCISDALMQGAKLAVEPYYDKDFFLDSLLMYQPSYVAATRSFWLNSAKKILTDEKYEDAKLKNLFLCFSAGEPFEVNEEKVINKALFKAKAGVNLTHTPLSVIKISEAGGDCEHGSIFYTLFREYASLKKKLKKNNTPELIRDDAAGLMPFPFVDVAVLDENGNDIGKNRLGRVVANSPCTMKGYKNNPEANKDFFIKDANGKDWGNLNVYGYIDDTGAVNIRGRIPKEGEKIPPFLLAKRVLKDTKNIMSCEVIQDEETGIYVAHFEMNPNAKISERQAIYEAAERCDKLVEKSGIDLYYRVRSNEESFPLTGSGKRSVQTLKSEGLTSKCVRPIKIGDEYFSLERYYKKENNNKVKSI